MKIFIPKDTSAVALDADDVAQALSRAQHALEAEICRNGSRGAFWRHIIGRRPYLPGLKAFFTHLSRDWRGRIEGGGRARVCATR